MYLILLCLLFTLHAEQTPALHAPVEVQQLIADGRHYIDAGDFTQATNCFLSAYEKPLQHEQMFELAFLLASVGMYNHAANIYTQLISIYGDHAEFYRNLGYCLRNSGKFQDAVIAYHAALACDPENNAAHLGLAMTYLFQGDYTQGWQLHERTLRRLGRNADKLHSWLRNNDTAGKTILLKPEGGFGDTLQFVRYARELKKYGLTVVVATQPQLYSILSRCPYIDHVVATNQSLTLPIDDWTTLMSIAPILYNHEQHLPPYSPYLSADPKLVEYWKNYFAHDHNVKVGISWQASVQNDASRSPVGRRGIPLQEFFALCDLPNVTWYSLQQVDGLEQLAQLPKHLHINLFDETFDKDHGAFEDSAAVLEHLDLLITVDSALAHLAGGMGKEVWLLLPYSTDWRWIHNASTSPWYPHMRIFKQKAPFDWQAVMEEVMVALLQKTASFRNTTAGN